MVMVEMPQCSQVGLWKEKTELTKEDQSYLTDFQEKPLVVILVLNPIIKVSPRCCLYGL